MDADVTNPTASTELSWVPLLVRDAANNCVAESFPDITFRFAIRGFVDKLLKPLPMSCSVSGTLPHGRIGKIALKGR